MSISKLLKITLSALLLAQTLIAQTVVNIPRGNSFTALLVFNSNYNPSRIDDISVWVGSKSWGTLEEGKVKTTANARHFRVEITSDETRNYTGRNEFIVSVKDSVLGVRKVIAGILNFTEAGRYSNAIVNSGVDWTVNINVSEAGITSNATLATIFKGDTGATGATGANAVNPNFTAATGVAGSNVSITGTYPNLTLTVPRGADAANPNFTAATGAAGSNVTITGTYPNLTLTVPRGDTGAQGAPGSDASVTSSNINTALGYVPVSPTQLGAKSDTSHVHPISKVTGLQAALDSKAASSHTHAQSDITGLVAQLGAKRDTSASITTAKISDWTAAWAARFAAQSTSDLAEGTNLYHTTARVQAVGDARYWRLSGFNSGENIDFIVGGTTLGRIHSGGNFSWGSTVNAGYKLDVNGIIYASGQILSNNNGFRSLGNGESTLFGRGLYISSGNIFQLSIPGGGETIGTFSGSSGNRFSSNIIHTINQSGTAGYTIYRASIFEQALGFGPKLLMDLGINSAANGGGTHESRYAIENTGKVLQATGANRPLNTVTLSGGTATVNNTLVTANSIISLTYQSCSNCGTAYISAKTAGTSFVITSTNASDASIIAYEIKN